MKYGYRDGKNTEKQAFFLKKGVDKTEIIGYNIKAV